MMQRNYPHSERPSPLYEEVQKLSDNQLSLMCHSRRIFPGPIDFRNRRHAERQLHIALIGERARFRAQQQFAEESRWRHNVDPHFEMKPPPPQQHYDFRTAVPEPVVPPRNYWPKIDTATWRVNPPPSSSFRYRQQVQDPVLESRQYVTWQQQQNWFHRQAAPEAQATNDTNILGFKLPFSLATARDITTKIGETLKRYQGVREDLAESRFQGGKSHQEASEDHSLREHQEYSDAECSYSCTEDYDQDTLYDPSEDEKQQQAYAQPLPYDFQELKALADTESQDEELPVYPSLSSTASTTTSYYDCASQEKIKQEASFSWWWWPQRATAGDERIPVAEQTRELEHRHEREVKSIDYIAETVSPCVEDELLELMGRVELREDSDEVDLVVLPDGTLGTRPASRIYGRFGWNIFRMLCCDRNGKLMAEKLCFTFLTCCMAFGIYVGYRRMQ